MAGRNQVTLIFDGEDKGLEKSFDRVGDSSKQMSREVDRSADSMRNAGAGFDRVGEAADLTDTRAMGFRDTITGVQDTMKGLSDDSLSLGDRLLTLGMGVGDLASGMFNFLIPTIKQLSTTTLANAKAWVTNTASTVANRAALVGQTIASGAARTATIAQTVAQKALNLAMRANPLGLIITLLFAAGVAIVALWKRSETFRRIVTGALNAVKAVASGVWSVITSGAQRLIGVFQGVGRTIAAPFRNAFQGIKNAWNSTIGGRGFETPDWLPFGLGDRSFRIPRLHTGGLMPGVPGSEGLAMLRAGERVTPASSSGGATVLEIRSGGSRMDDFLVEMLRRSIRTRGGDVQVVLGRA